MRIWNLCVVGKVQEPKCMSDFCTLLYIHHPPKTSKSQYHSILILHTQPIGLNNVWEVHRTMYPNYSTLLLWFMPWVTAYFTQVLQVSINHWLELHSWMWCNWSWLLLLYTHMNLISSTQWIQQNDLIQMNPIHNPEPWY